VATSGTLDVSRLPAIRFGHRAQERWGTLALIAIEGSVFTLAAASYFYLRSRETAWPPNGPGPNLLFGTLNTVLLLASLWPALQTKKVAERQDLGGVRREMLIDLPFALAFLVVRWFEFSTLNVRWDANAYGSIVWTLLGLHTTHLVTDFIDTVVLLTMVMRDPVEPKRYVDVAENSFYWIFVVVSWLPLYLLIYWAPRLL
jgi:cytochrome c oxidase subunit III